MFPGFGSGWVVLTVPVLIASPGWVGTTTRTTVTDAPAARVPRGRVATPLTSVPKTWFASTDWNKAPGKRGSVNTTLVAGDGPLLVTTAV